MRVVAKDDCFTAFVAAEMAARGVSFELLAREEKVHSQVLCDALDGLRADPAVVWPFVRGAPYALPFNLSLASLAVSGADLILVGSFADLTVRPYRHRAEGWRFFELAARLRPEVSSLFERDDLIEPAASMRNTLRLFDHYAQASPRARKVWVSYPFVPGDMLAWDSPVAGMNDERMRARFESFRQAAHAALVPAGVLVLDIPAHLVRSRDGVFPWHYPDAVYAYAADYLLEVMS